MTALDDSGAAAREAADPEGGCAGTVMDGMQRLSLASWPAQRTPTSQPQHVASLARAIAALTPAGMNTHPAVPT